MTVLHEDDPGDASLFKYNRKHLLEMFDALHQRAEFPHSLDYVPEQTVLSSNYGGGGGLGDGELWPK